MSPGSPIEMQESVALGAERAACAAINYGNRGTVIVIRAVRPRLRIRIAPATVAITVNSAGGFR